jgi:hypothetical protein
MKKKISSILILFTIAVVAAWNVNLGAKSYDWSTVSLANVEALAQESGTILIPCCESLGDVCIYVAVNAQGELQTWVLNNFRYCY